MIGSQINIGLNFQANSAAAQQSIQALQNSLTQISSIKPTVGANLNKDLNLAITSAKSLQQHMTNAFNVKTGNLDLGKLNLSLSQANQSLSGLTANLLGAGVQGERAFINMQNSVSMAHVKINKTNTLLKSFATTLANTAKWQLSSTMLHGFISSIQSAIDYTTKLNRNLNAIRIVTGYGVDEMAEFADKANKAAKALSTTTNEYAKGSLIYFQQGLSMEEVEQRANVTAKMAHVTQQSTETVSDQMTAIWNNFYDGSKSLEYYADVLTKLGATTASSTDEIAGGLEKFAGVADTIGLSYEYAASALATITAETRQSEDVVGTALKTIFARLQGLKLGETLEDGTDLNKYSEALATVGVNIKDVNGEVKNMDTILDETAAKWKTLGKDQQVALAQSAAGVRQYTHFVTLMDDWEKVKENINVSTGSGGNLEKQHNIYEESLQASKDRVKATTEDMWSNLLPEELLINITELFNGILTVVEKMVTAFGGLEGIMLMISTVALTKLGPSIAQGIDLGIAKFQSFKQVLESEGSTIFSTFGDKIKSHFASIFKPGQYTLGLRESFQSALGPATTLTERMQSMTSMSKLGVSYGTKQLMLMNQEAATRDRLTDSMQTYLKDTSQVYQIQGMIEKHKNNISKADQLQLSQLQQQALEVAKRKQLEAENLEIIQLQIEREKERLSNKLFNNAGYNDTRNTSSLQVNNAPSLMQNGGAEKWLQYTPVINDMQLKINQINESLVLTSDKWYGIQSASLGAKELYGTIYALNLKLNEVLNDETVGHEQKKKQLNEEIDKLVREEKITEQLAVRLRGGVGILQDKNKNADRLRLIFSKILGEAEVFAKLLQNSDGALAALAKLIEQEFFGQKKVNGAAEEQREIIEQTGNALLKTASSTATWGSSFSAVISKSSQVAMGINMIQNAITTLNDEDADWSTKLLTGVMGLTMGYSALETIVGGLIATFQGYAAIQGGLISATAALNAVKASQNTLTAVEAVLTKLTTGEIEKETAQQQISEILRKKGVATKTADALATKLLILWKGKDTQATDKETVANWANFTSQMARFWIIGLIVLILAVLVAAIVGVIYALNAEARANKKNAEEMQELYEKTKELKEETETLNSEIVELIKTFQEQRAAGQDTGETYDQLSEKISNLISKYEELGVSQKVLDKLKQGALVGLATGSWDLYDEAAVEAEEEADSKLKHTAYANAQAQAKKAKTDFAEHLGNKEGKRHIGNGGTGLSKKEQDIFKKYNDILTVAEDGLSADLDLDFTNAFTTKQSYDRLVQLRDEMAAAELADTGTYDEINTEIESMAESMDALNESYDEAVLYKMQEALSNFGIEPEQITSLQQYATVLNELVTDEMIEEFGSREAALEAAKKYLNSFSNTSNAAAHYGFIENFGKRIQENNVKYEIDYEEAYDVDQGKMVTHMKEVKVTPTMDEDALKEEIEEISKYFDDLPENKKSIVYKVNLDYIKNFEEFKDAAEELIKFEATVKLKADPSSIISSTKATRDTFGDMMSDFSEQGYLTTTQAAELIAENPAMAQYLVETKNGFALTTKAVKEYNNALKEQKEALSELLDPELIEEQALFKFAEDLISLSAGVSDTFEEPIGKIKDLTKEFVEGKIEAEEYFKAINKNIKNINTKDLKYSDLYELNTKILPGLLSGLNDYAGAIQAAFKSGKISADEYRKSLLNIAKQTKELYRKQIAAIKNQNNIDLEFDETTDQWKGLTENAEGFADSLNNAAESVKQLEKAIKDFETVEFAADAITANYDILSQYFDEDFTIKVDVNVDEAIKKTQQFRNDLAANFAAMSEDAQQHMIGMIKNAEMGTDSVKALAVRILNGTANIAEESATDVASAQELIMKTTGGAVDVLGSNITTIVTEMQKIIKNFEATINVQAVLDKENRKQLVPKWVASTLSGGLWDGTVSTFSFKIKGSAGNATAKSIDNIGAAIQNLANFAGEKTTLSSFAPTDYSPASPTSPNLDEDPDEEDGNKGKDGDKDKTKSKKAETKDPNQEVTRYRNTDNLLEKQERVLNKLSRKKDGAYGKKYLEAIEAENKAIAEENALLEWQATEALTYRDQDIEALKSFGIEVVLDENGNISNLESIEKQIAERENNIEIEYAAKYNAAGENEEAQEAADEWKKQQEKDLKSIKFYFDGATKASEKYYDVTEQMEENLMQIKENNFEKIQKKLEDQIELIDRENEMIELQNKLLEDNYKKSPELYQNIFKINKNDLKSLNEYIASYNKAMDPNEQLTDTHRAELIQKAYDGITDKIGAFIDRFNDMKQAFSDAMDSWNDDMQLIYDQFDHFIGITESYEEIMGLLGRSTDYTALGNLYSARETHSREKYLASVGEYDAKLKLIQEERAKLESGTLNETQKAITEENIKKLTEEVHNAQQTMLDNAVEWGEVLKLILNNTLAAANKALQETLLGMTFDEINEQMDQLQAKQEDYLTETNKQYETQKLIRTAQLAIEKTENEVARRKLELFKKETQEIQNQSKLSQFELDVRQAEYDLLLAEIALQEAQNTKSQVRLQRDSEGNFNYVYTADENKIAEAQQAYEDAENKLYNIRLEGANDFAQKHVQIMNEWYDAVQEIYENEELTAEERNEKVAALTEYYQERLLNNQELYNEASSQLGDQLNEAWTTDMMNNIASAEEFQVETNNYIQLTQGAFGTFQKEINRLSGLVNGDFSEVKGSASKLSEQMKTTQTEGSTALQQLSQATTTWAGSAEGNLLKIIGYWTTLGQEMGLVLSAMSGYTNEVDYMAGFETSSNIASAKAFLDGREKKYTADSWYREQYGDNATALMEEERNQHEQMLTANTVAEKIAAAARRFVKLDYIDQNTAQDMIAKYGNTWQVLMESLNLNKNDQQSIIDNFIDAYDLSSYVGDLLTIARKDNAGELIIKKLEEIQNANPYNYYVGKNKKSIYGELFDTGGYTGEFGPEGRYAVLHEKELVLNADDTANLLDTIDIVRGLVDNIEYRALMQSFGRMSAPIVNLTNETLEQDVTIHAEFPNVQDKNEIEEAFNNLINTASQYANRKNR